MCHPRINNCYTLVDKLFLMFKKTLTDFMLYMYNYKNNIIL